MTTIEKEKINMAAYEHSFTIQSDTRVTFHDVTDSVRKFAQSCPIENGIVLVYSQHTTCSVLIQEQSDDTNFYGEQFILQDLVNVLSKIIPTCETEAQYLHPGPLHVKIAAEQRAEEKWWSLNTDAHLRSVLLGRSVTIPLSKKELLLGEFGRIYFADFDQVRARQRTVRVHIVG
jgi:secondary thiamine-phosphate synthase enzyme